MSKPASAFVTRRDVLMSGAAVSAALSISSTSALGADDASPTSRTPDTRRANMQSTHSKPSIVLCHGVWADGSCFSKVIPALQAEGHQVIAAQYGLNTLAGDVATVKHALGRVSSPAVLVGHSYGGTVITAAGTDSRVAALVYIAALAPDADETTQSQLDKYPKTDVLSHVEVADGRVWMHPDGV